jgi:hypothetical protein
VFTEGIWKAYCKKEERSRERFWSPSHVSLKDEVPQKSTSASCVDVWKLSIHGVRKFNSQ